MVARALHAAGPCPHACPRLLTVVVIAGALAPLPAGPAQGAGPGRWSQLTDWSGGDSHKYAVHVMLVRGDNNPFNSRILWWGPQGPNQFPQFHGGEWGWKAGSESCDAFPVDSLVALGIGLPGEDIFCSRHAMLADPGRVLVAGGSSPGTYAYGISEASIYARGPGTTAGTWSTADTMSEWRW